MEKRYCFNLTIIVSDTRMNYPNKLVEKMKKME